MKNHPVNQRVREIKSSTKTKKKFGSSNGDDDDEEEEEVQGSQIIPSSSSSDVPSALIKRFHEKDDGDATTTTTSSSNKKHPTIPLEAIRENDLAEHEALFGQSIRPNTEHDTCPPWQNPLHHNNPEMERIFAEDFPGGVIPPEALVPAPPVKDVDGSGIYAPQNVVDICNDMLQLNMLEMAALHQKICAHFGFPYDDPLTGGGGGGGMGGGGGAAAAPEPEVAAAPVKTVFDVKLVGFDEKSKIKVIKEVRAAVPGLGLKEAKELVEGAPKVITKDVKPEVAEELKKKLEEAGAIIEIV